MLKLYGKQLALTFKVIEITIMAGAFAALYAIVEGWGAEGIYGVQPGYRVFITGEMALWLFLSHRFRLYGSKRTVRFPTEMKEVLFTATLSAGIATLAAFLAAGTTLGWKLLVQAWLLQSALVVMFRLTLREFLKFIRTHGSNYRQVLIVGQNNRVDDLVSRIEDSPEFGLRILGYVDAGRGKDSRFHVSEYNFLGSISSMERIMRENVVDEVFVLLPIKSFYPEIERIVSLCETVGIEVTLSADLFMHKLAKPELSSYDDLAVISLYSSPRMDWRLVLKRFIDIAVSGAALIVLSPLLIVVAALVKATSKGPVIFRQKRKCYNGRLFDCLKFRTMVDGAEGMKRDLLSKNEMDGPVFKIKADPRITRLGRILRMTSIDELPQLFNVLKGDMSLVGPRPPLPDEVIQYELPCLRRLSMKPGLTCLWQVSGRNSVPFEKWMELDRHYIDHWSLWLDFKIMLKTIPVVLKCTGG